MGWEEEYDKVLMAGDVEADRRQLMIQRIQAATGAANCEHARIHPEDPDCIFCEYEMDWTEDDFCRGECDAFMPLEWDVDAC